MTVYGKGQKDDLSADDKRLYRQLARSEAAGHPDQEPEGDAMKDTPKCLPLAERRKGLEEAIRHTRGEITLKTTVLELPDEPPEIDAPTLVAFGTSRGCPRPFSPAAQRLDQDRPKLGAGPPPPSHASRRLIQIYSQHPETVCPSVGLPPITLQGVTIERLPPDTARSWFRALELHRK